MKYTSHQHNMHHNTTQTRQATAQAHPHDMTWYDMNVTSLSSTHRPDLIAAAARWCDSTAKLNGWIFDMLICHQGAARQQRDVHVHVPGWINAWHSPIRVWCMQQRRACRCNPHVDNMFSFFIRWVVGIRERSHISWRMLVTWSFNKLSRERTWAKRRGKEKERKQEQQPKFTQRKS